MSNWIKGNRKALAFLRVSSSKQDGGTSHDNQERQIREYCDTMELELVEVVKLVESAKDADGRKEYNAAHQRALKQDIRHLVFLIYDRETRNLTDNEINESLVREDKIVLHYASDRKVIHKGSPDADFFLRDIQAVTNKNYIRILSTKVKDALRVKAEDGWYPTNHPTLGYVHYRPLDANGKPSKQTTIIVDPNTDNVRLVRREFELRAIHRLSFREIRKQIIKEGLVPANKIKTYYASGIEKRLKNKFYKGYFDHGGLEYKGKHELIISPSIYNAVEESFGWRGRSTKKKGVFTGFIRCADPSCGCQVIYDPKVKTNRATGEKRTYHYYRCSNSKEIHPTMRGMTLTEDSIWNGFEPAIHAVSISADFAQKIADALNKNKEKTLDAARREISAYSGALKGLEDKEDRIYEDYRAGVLDSEAYKRQVERIRKDRRHYTELMAQKNLAITDAGLETAKSVLELATRAESLWNSKNSYERLDMLNKLQSNPLLDGSTIKYHLRKPYLKLVEMKKNQEWLPGRDLNPRQGG